MAQRVTLPARQPATPARVAARVAFAALGFGSLWLYLLAVAWALLLPDNLYRPLQDLGKLTGSDWASTLRFVFLVGGLFLLYGLGYRLVVRGAVGPRPVLGLAACFAFALVWAYPGTAADVFGYAAQGRVLAEHGANPFRVAPAAFPAEPILPYLAFPREPSQYGPLWALIEAGIAALTGGHLAGEVLAYKVLAALAHLVAALAVLGLARRLTPRRARAVAGAYLFAWNPLLLWESAANAHNDVLMALGVLGALWMLERRWTALVLPLLALAALVKLPAVAIAPVLVLVTWRRDRRAALVGAALAAALAAAAYWPFWFGIGTITALGRTQQFSTSLASELLHALAPTYGNSRAGWLAHAVTGALLLAAYLPILVAASRARTTLRALTLCYAALLAFLVLGIAWFQPWYVVWPFALAAALPVAARHRELALYSLGALGTYLVWVYLWPMRVLPGGTPTARHLAFVLAVVPLLAGLALASRRRPGPGRRGGPAAAAGHLTDLSGSGSRG